MIVMAANSTGWFWHCLARETGRIGHLYSPGAQRGPWPWFPYALDNGAFSCWDMQTNIFDESKWIAMESRWKQLIYWASSACHRPKWAIVPDVPGNGEATIERWGQFAQYVVDAEILPAIAVQDGMTVEQVKDLRGPSPGVICVGGTTDFKWKSVQGWKNAFARVHVLRCNSPDKLHWLESIGVESCDGTGWNRGDRSQTEGLEAWARLKPTATLSSLSPYVCRSQKNGQMEWPFAREVPA